MGSFHCISSNRSIIKWKPYSGGGLKYRYGSGNWSVIYPINGGNLTYTAEEEKGKCFTTYSISTSWVLRKCYQHRIFSQGTHTRNVTGKINGIFIGKHPTSTFSGTTVYLELQSATGVKSYVNLAGTTAPPSYSACYTTNTKDPLTDYISVPASTASITNISRVDGQPDNCGDCIFKVFENGIQIFETRNPDCPEVQNQPCEIEEDDTWNQHLISKISYLERIEVLNYGYGIAGIEQIPSECLNIYKSNITFTPSPIPSPFGLSGTEFIEQICSSPGCPPPQYDVACQEDGRECPQGTCPCVSNDTVCCYNDQGIAIEEIPLDEYTGQL